MKIVAFAGQCRSGKTYSAQYTAKALGIERASWASSVKECFCTYFGVDYAFIEEWKTKAETPPRFDMPVRKSLQFIGDGFRQINHNIWVDRLLKIKEGRDIIIDDSRYNSELQRVRELGGINVLMWRPGFENDDPNDSEAQIKILADYFKGTDIDGVVPPFKMNGPPNSHLVDIFLRNDGNQEQLHAKLDTAVEYIKSRLFGG